MTYHKKYALYNIIPRPPRIRVPENIRKPRPAGHRLPHHRSQTVTSNTRTRRPDVYPPAVAFSPCGRPFVSRFPTARSVVPACTASAARTFYVTLVQWTNNTLRRPCGRHFAAISCAVWSCVCALRKHRSRLVRIYFFVSRNNIIVVQRLH